jgi:hypothetical protein
LELNYTKVINCPATTINTIGKILQNKMQENQIAGIKKSKPVATIVLIIYATG